MSSKEFTARTFAWLRLLKGDHDLTALAVGLQLTEHFNEKEGGQARVGYRFIADALGVRESTVVRAVHRMHDRGRLRVEWGQPGRGHPNRYWMVIKPAPEQVLDPRKRAPENLRQRQIKPAPAQQNHLKNHIPWGAKAPPRDGEREDALARIAHPPGACAPHGRAPVSEERHAHAAVGGESEKRLSEDRKHAVAVEADCEGFAEARRAWPRPWPDHDDVEAFAAYRIARQEVGHPAIIKSLQAWAEAADAPRFLPKLSRWFADRCFLRGPPTKRKARERATYQRKPTGAELEAEINAIYGAPQVAVGGAL